MGKPPGSYYAERGGDCIEQGIGIVHGLHREIKGRYADRNQHGAYYDYFRREPVEHYRAVVAATGIAVLLPVPDSLESHQDIVDVQGRERPGGTVEKVEGRADATGDVEIPHKTAVKYLQHQKCDKCYGGDYFENLGGLGRKECKYHINNRFSVANIEIIPIFAGFYARALPHGAQI